MQTNPRQISLLKTTSHKKRHRISNQNRQRFVGKLPKAGWNRSVRERLGGVHGCTHLIELLGRLGTVAYQTVFPIREREREAKRAAAEPGADDKSARPPRLLDSCYAWRADGPVVQEYLPAHYRGIKG